MCLLSERSITSHLAVFQISQSWYINQSKEQKTKLTAKWGRWTQTDGTAHTVTTATVSTLGKIIKYDNDQVSVSCSSSCLPSFPTSLGFTTSENLLVADKCTCAVFVSVWDVCTKRKIWIKHASGVQTEVLSTKSCHMSIIQQRWVHVETRRTKKCNIPPKDLPITTPGTRAGILKGVHHCPCVHWIYFPHRQNNMWFLNWKNERESGAQ